MSRAEPRLVADGPGGRKLVDVWGTALGLAESTSVDDPVRVLLADTGGAVEFALAGQRAKFGPRVCGPEVQGRVKSRVQSKDPLLKAIGRHARVLDATAGWCRDALVLAAAGNEVVACEQHPVVGRLVALAVAQALDDAWFLQWIAPRFRVWVGDAREKMSAGGFEVIYLDPMFAEGETKAGVKKDIAALRALVGEGTADEGAGLVAAALQAGAKRVVVKRAKNAPPLVEGVSHAVPGKAHRFDVYDMGD